MTHPARNSHRGIWTGASGHRLAWEAFDGTAPLSVVFVHGGGQRGRTWRRAARLLQEAGYPVLIYDQRGHGDSDWMPDGDYRLDSFQADLDCVLAHWQRPAVLVGASLGGLVSLLSASERPATVRGLVMIDTAPQLNPAEIDRLVSFLAIGAGEGFDSPAEAAQHVRKYFPAKPVTPEAIEASLLQSAAGRWFWRWDVRVVVGEFNSVALPHEERLHARASQVAVPFLLIRSGNSPLVSDEAVQRLQSLAPQLEVEWLHGADHVVGAEEAAEVVQLVCPFIERCAGAGGE